jgi:hypothetical protein
MPVLSIHAARGLADQNRVLAAAFRARPGRPFDSVEVQSDHAFADARIALAAEVVRWIGTNAER